MKRISGLFKSSGVQTVASSGIVLLLTVLTGVLSARLLQVNERGVTAAVLAFVAMLTQAGNAGPAETQLLAPQRGHPLGATIRITWLYSLCIVLLAAIPAVVYLRVMTHSDTVLLLVVATTPAAAMAGLLCNYLLLGEKRYGASALLRTLPIALQTLALITLWLLHAANVLTVILASWIAGLAAGIIALMLAKPWAHSAGPLKPHAADITKMIFTLGGSHSLRIIGYRLDLILLGALSGGYAAGLYSVATSLTAAGNSLTANLTPLVTTHAAGKNSVRFTQVSSLLALCIAIGIAAFGPLLIPLVYGRNYAPSWVLIGVLATSMYSSFLLDTTNRLFQRAGLERTAMRVSVVVLILQLAAISVGSITLGAKGAALGNLFAYGCGVMILLVLARHDPHVGRLAHQLSPFAGLHILIARILQR